MSKESRERRAYERRYSRLVAGTASREDESLLGFGGEWNRAKLRRAHKWWDNAKASLLMDDFQYADYCIRDWVPQLLHKGKKP